MEILNVFYLIIVLLVALVSLATGFRRGCTMQLSSVLGFAFGAVAARVFTHPFSQYFMWVEHFSPAPEFNEFSVNLVTAGVIYSIVYWLFSILSGILRKAMAVLETGIFNRLLGSFFTLIKNLLWLSLFLNLMICFKSESGLLGFERANDGNPVAAVMELTPMILGCYGGEDFAHIHQLKEAKSISCNMKPEDDNLQLSGLYTCYINRNLYFSRC